MTPRLIDVHTHVQFAAYKDEVSDVIERALSDNIWLVNVGTQRDTSEAAIKLAEKYEEGVYATVGLHPIHTTQSYHDKKELGDGDAAKAFTSRGEEFDIKTYVELASHPKVVAIGETGLDYYRLDATTKDKQIEVFEGHVGLSKEVGKPLMIHCREGSELETKEGGAFSDLIKVLKDNALSLKSDGPGIIHFFTGDVANARELLELGFLFSFGGVITFAKDYNEVIKLITLDRIVLETDAPYVAPIPFRGKTNEPAYVAHTANKIAEILGEEVGVVEEKTTANARKILGI